MTGEPAVDASIVVVGLAAVLAGLLVITGRRRHLPLLAVVATVVLVVVGTALPTHWSVASGTDLRLAPGHGGLGKAGLQLVRGSPGAAVELFVLNAVVYLPLGAALRWRWPHRLVLLVVPLVVSVGVEATQYAVLDRVAATDDVLLNVGGAVIGWALLWWWQRATADRAMPDRATPGPDARRSAAPGRRPTREHAHGDGIKARTEERADAVSDCGSGS